MHSMVKFIINSIADDKPIDWAEVHKELDRITISQREKKLCIHLHSIYMVMQVAKNGE